MTEIASPARSVAEPRWGLWLALALACLLVVRLFSLLVNQTELMFDEAQYWAWSLEPAFGYFSKPPLLAWAIAATTGVCGHGEACVRLASPLFYTATGVFIYLAAARLHDERTGFWAAIVFVTTPGVSFSSGIISTDVPLLFFWSVALYGWIALLQDRSWKAALVLGAAIGLGLMSKYAMVYFYLCAAIWLVMDRESRWLLRDVRALALIVLPAVLFAPNIAWNLQNGLVTFSHTADNANWSGSLVNPIGAIEFFGAQFGVFGPILFGALVWGGVRAVREGMPRDSRMMLAFSLPIVILITIQAFLSRAHANWAAAAYPAAAIFVTAVLLRENWRRLFAISLALHLFVQVALTAGVSMANTLALPGNIDPFARVLGWRDTAALTREELARGDYAAVISDSRAMTAELLYYMRAEETPVLAWRQGDAPQDHFELTRPYVPETAGTVLLVSLWPDPRHVTRRFSTVRKLGEATVGAGAKATRDIHFFALSGYQER